MSAYVGRVRDVLAELMSIWRAGDTAGLGTVVRTFRSAPRPPGASMVVAPDGSVTGSVSGGCVEGAVYELATEVAKTGTPRLERYGVSDDDAFAVGLTCGGIIDVFVESVSQATFPELGAVADDIGEHRAVAVATVIAHPDAQSGRPAGRHPAGRDGRHRWVRRAPTPRSPTTRAACSRWAAARSSSTDPTGSGSATAWRSSCPVTRRAPRMLVFGAIDFAAALAQQGSFLGYRVTVCDARAGVRHPGAFPDGRRRRRRLAPPLSRRPGRGGRHRSTAR